VSFRSDDELCYAAEGSCKSWFKNVCTEGNGKACTDVLRSDIALACLTQTDTLNNIRHFCALQERHKFTCLLKMLFPTCISPCSAIIRKIIHIRLWKNPLALHLYRTCVNCETEYKSYSRVSIGLCEVSRINSGKEYKSYSRVSIGLCDVSRINRGSECKSYGSHSIGLCDVGGVNSATDYKSYSRVSIGLCDVSRVNSGTECKNYSRVTIGLCDIGRVNTGREYKS
jgi:hypothetical protein